jgi:hypothetical protein
VIDGFGFFFVCLAGRGMETGDRESEVFWVVCCGFEICVRGSKFSFLRKFVRGLVLTVLEIFDFFDFV